MNRTLPLDVRRALRKQVGYGCPFPDCRSPFLTWHHFDPPWHEQQHQNPAGIIALCGKHHRFADAGHYSKEELHALKESRPSPEDVKAHLPWTKKNFLIRAGGEYRANSPCFILLEAKPLIGLVRHESGFLSLSFDLETEDGEQRLAVQENDLTFVEDNLFDLEISESAKNVKVWDAAQAIGLNLTFNRITPDELDQILAKDEERSLKGMKDAGIPPSASIGTGPSMSALALSHPDLLARAPKELVEWLRAGVKYEITIRNLIQKSAREDCMEDDGLIPFLNFRIMVTYYKRKRIEIRDGIQFEGGGRHHFNFGQGNVAVSIGEPRLSSDNSEPRLSSDNTG